MSEIIRSITRLAGKNPCPEFPYWGAPYPDARCVNGILYDLDKCDDEGNLIKPIDDVYCPFCKTREFIDSDPFGWENSIYYELLSIDMDEEEAEMEAKDQAEEKYLEYIQKMRKLYGKE